MVPARTGQALLSTTTKYWKSVGSEDVEDEIELGANPIQSISPPKQPTPQADKPSLQKDHLLLIVQDVSDFHHGTFWNASHERLLTLGVTES